MLSPVCCNPESQDGCPARWSVKYGWYDHPQKDIFFFLNISSHFEGHRPRRSLSTSTGRRNREHLAEQKLLSFIGFFLSVKWRKPALFPWKKKNSAFVPCQPDVLKVKEHYWFSIKPFTLTVFPPSLSSPSLPSFESLSPLSIPQWSKRP